MHEIDDEMVGDEKWQKILLTEISNNLCFWELAKWFNRFGSFFSSFANLLPNKKKHKK